MKRGMLVILCVLSSIYPLLSAWRHSVDVKVAGPEGSVTLRKFQPATDSESGLQQEAADFCQSISANSEDCEQNVIDLYNRIRSLPTWKNGEELAHRFAHNQATDYCNEPTQYRGFSSYDECYANVTRAIRRSKVVNAYQLSYKAEALISNNTLMPLPAGWKDGVEGNTFQCITKVQALQDIADDPRVVRICEIGFNMGHSTLNWLAANPIAEVLSFDIARTAYVAPAVNAVHQLFPDRVHNLIMGDSASSVPNFRRFLYGDDDHQGHSPSAGKYNVIFIDGNHAFDGALTDIVTLATFANRTYHRIIVDDGLYSEVRRAWDHAVNVLGIVRTVSILPIREGPCMKTVPVESGPLKDSYQFVSCVDEPEWYFDDLIVGEYI